MKRQTSHHHNNNNNDPSPCDMRDSFRGSCKVRPGQKRASGGQSDVGKCLTSEVTWRGSYWNWLPACSLSGDVWQLAHVCRSPNADPSRPTARAFFSLLFSVFSFFFGGWGARIPPVTPKVYTGNRRVRKLVGIGADAQPPSPPEDGTLPIVFGGLRRAGRIRIGGSLVGGQERENAPEHIRQDGTRPNRSRETVETVKTHRGQDIAPMKRPAKTGYDTGQERRGQDKRCRLRYHTHHILPLEHNTVQMTSRE